MAATTKPRMTKKMRAFLVALAKNNLNISKTCEEVGMARVTHYDWLEKNLQYRTLFEELEESRLDMAEDSLLKAANIGNVQAAIFLLKTKGKKRGYGENLEVSSKVALKTFKIEDIFSAN